MHEVFTPSSSDSFDLFAQSLGLKIAFALALGVSVATVLATLSSFLESYLGTKGAMPSATTIDERPDTIARLFRYGATRGVEMRPR